ncbi:uncharacterized protein SRS1_13376 [Sporisorium reilianum f. sp. reilianum]|uniref:Effector family protein Eff1 n=1 Tax=Sporisorium reilianum f. sp. reilianum TaxID=72559 RepID=A0A2N8UC09_9BASI|nr:uncharacterized protein SRS1_13376 [Sporisorium reilianum f. sp. reilianum]
MSTMLLSLMLGIAFVTAVPMYPWQQPNWYHHQQSTTPQSLTNDGSHSVPQPPAYIPQHQGWNAPSLGEPSTNGQHSAWPQHGYPLPASLVNVVESRYPSAPQSSTYEQHYESPQSEQEYLADLLNWVANGEGAVREDHQEPQSEEDYLSDRYTWVAKGEGSEQPEGVIRQDVSVSNQGAVWWEPASFRWLPVVKKIPGGDSKAVVAHMDKANSEDIERLKTFFGPHMQWADKNEVDKLQAQSLKKKSPLQRLSRKLPLEGTSPQGSELFIYMTRHDANIRLGRSFNNPTPHLYPHHLIWGVPKTFMEGKDIELVLYGLIFFDQKNRDLISQDINPGVSNGALELAQRIHR